jgi:hypothetical protein
VGGLEDEVWGEKEVAPKTRANLLPRLNKALERVAWPWFYEVLSGLIRRSG